MTEIDGLLKTKMSAMFGTISIVCPYVYRDISPTLSQLNGFSNDSFIVVTDSLSIKHTKPQGVFK